MTTIRLGGVAAVLLLAAPVGLAAQAVTPVGSVRVRSETLDWFGSSPGGGYSFLGALARLGLEQQRPRFGWRIEFATPVLLGLPSDAATPAPSGLLGQGANYYRANGDATNSATVFLKQAYLRLVTGDQRWQARAGRFEFIEGAELTPANPTLAAVKRTRIAQRLIGSFGFTHVGRSIDGAELQFTRSRANVTVMAGLPTAGVFTTDGWGHVGEGEGEVGLGYGAVTAPGPWGADRGEFRVFAIYYRDSRNTLKADNRSLAARQADQTAIAVGTVGAHYLQVLPTGTGPIDLLGWGAYQFGDWGRLEHRAFAGTVELGWQPKVAIGVRPWLRVGYFRGSGDSDPVDGTHGTFFQVLPTPRPYARFPFFNLMNLEDLSASLSLRPGSRTTLRFDVRRLRLASRADGWYLGGGAFAKDDFGFALRPSSQFQNLATLADLSVDVRLASRWTVGLYGARATAGPVIQAIYPTQPGAWYGYLEVEYRLHPTTVSGR